MKIAILPGDGIGRAIVAVAVGVPEPRRREGPANETRAAPRGAAPRDTISVMRPVALPHRRQGRAPAPRAARAGTRAPGAARGGKTTTIKTT
jgi:hypothetical protein